MARGRFFIAQPGTWAVLLWLGVSGCAADSHSAINTDEALSGGETTTFETSRSAYSYPAANLEGARRDRFFVGNAVFNRTWVAAPSSTTGLDGLGPTFNATSCDACHFKDGRGAPPEGDDPFLGLLIRLSIPGEGAHGGPNPEPRYGEQFNHHAVLDVPAEGSAQVDYDEVAGAYADGAGWSLRAPLYRFDDLAFGPMDDEVMVSPRVANTMVGLGLLEAVPEETLVALEDPDDANADGVSGRANRVWDVERGTTVLGRFGWKANQPSLRQQIAGAFIGDIGITSSIFPNQNCPAPQLDCADAISGGEPELDGDKLEDVTYYASLLGVPARRDVDDPEVRKGKARFESFGCAACHTETLRTGDSDLFP
ncbi:MAG: thiol oxidoreductase, partial [Myxococcales bacterium]|nr:thiol oxidoreductase [Myxococcales bacterium]